MFGALGALSGSKNPLINPGALFDKKKDDELPPLGTVNRSGSLPSSSSSQRYGRGATSLSL